jgi:hypothetical protein
MLIRFNKLLQRNSMMPLQNSLTLALTKLTYVSPICGVGKEKKLLYDCISATIIDKATLKVYCESKLRDLIEEIPTYFIVLGFSSTGNPIQLS